jgi:hypothetical protein
MNLFVSYQSWFVQMMKPNIQYAIAQYDIEERSKKERSLRAYWRKLENVQKNPTLVHKSANYEKIIYTSEIQLDAFPSYDDMDNFLRSLESVYPIEVLRRPMEGIEKRQFDLLVWIRDHERSLFQLIIMKERGLRKNRNNRIRHNIERNWLSLSMGKRPENIENAYQIRNGESANVIKQKSNIMKKRSKLIKQNNYDLYVSHKKRHLKTDDCAYDFLPRSREEQIAFLQQIERNQVNRSNLRYSFRQNWIETIRALGIDHLSFLETNDSPFLNNENRHRNQMKEALINLINLYLIPIQEDQDDIRTLHCENVMMCISYILYEDETQTDIRGEPIAHGLFGQVIPFGNKIYKKENLRMMSNIEFKTMHTNPTPLFKKYLFNSYITCQVLFGFMIQKYLYNLNSAFIPNIHNVEFLFETENPFSITKMNDAGSRLHSHSMTLKNILLNTDISRCENFIVFIFKVIIRLCDILKYYQDRCFFIHRDLHEDNIFVHFNIIQNGSNRINIENFSIKLIDFSLSSICIHNQSEHLSQLCVTNLKPYWNSKPLNPCFNKDWRQMDLTKFFIFMLCKTFMEFIQNPNGSYKYPREHIEKLDQIENQIKILLNMKELDRKTYRQRYNEFTSRQCMLGSKRIDMFLKKRVRFDILGIDEEDEQIFDPTFCKRKIETTILPGIER